MYPFDLAKLTIVRYRRKSSEAEDRQIASLDDQAQALAEVAGRFRIEPSQIAADFGESRSAKQSHTRPEFQRMIAMIERGDANAILTWHPDRLSRNLGDIDVLIRLMESGNLAAIITPQYMFANTPLEKYILISECTRAKLENDNKSVNVKRGLYGKARRGWQPGVAKIGYLNDKTKLKGERDLIPDPERYDKVKRLLRMFLNGDYSVRALHRAARDQLVIRTRTYKKQGGRPLSLSHIYRILTDPFYYGWYWWTNPETGEKEFHLGKHLPMISEAEFWQIQALLGRGMRPQRKTQTFAYTALMTCGECGAAITAEEKWQIICGHCKTKFAAHNREACPGCRTPLANLEKKKLLHYVYYHCAKSKGPCSQKSVRVEALEAQIDQALARFNISEKYVRWALETLRVQARSDAAVVARANHDVKKETVKLRDELAELNRFIIKQENAGWTLMSREEALAEKRRLAAELKSLEPAQAVKQGDGLDETAGTLDYACYARLWLKAGSPEQKREVFAALGSNLTLKDKKVRIDLTYPLPEIEKMIEIAPEIISTFEPADSIGTGRVISSFSKNCPTLRRGLNAIRTYFMKSGRGFWQPRREYSPTIRGGATKSQNTQQTPRGKAEDLAA